MHGRDYEYQVGAPNPNRPPPMRSHLLTVVATISMMVGLSSCEKHLEHNQDAPATQSESANKDAPPTAPAPSVDSQGPSGRGS